MIFFKNIVSGPSLFEKLNHRPSETDGASSLLEKKEGGVEDPFNLNMIAGDDDIAYHDRVKSNNSLFHY